MEVIENALVNSSGFNVRFHLHSLSPLLLVCLLDSLYPPWGQPKPYGSSCQQKIVPLEPACQQGFLCLEKRRDTVGELRSVEIFVSYMLSKKAKRLGRLA